MRRRRHDRQVLLLALGASLPGLAIAVWFVWTTELSPKLQWTLTALLAVSWLGFLVALRERVVRPLQVLANLLGAIREGDYTLRARGAPGDDALGLAFAEVNELGDALRRQRFREIEALALLDKVLAEIPSAIFVLDEERKLRLANRAGTELLGLRREQLLGRAARDVGLADCLEGEPARILDAAFAGGAGRWDLRRRSVREEGESRELLVLTSLERALRAEERQAWQRLIRVLSHEINNSLAPIQSIAGTLLKTLSSPLEGDWRGDFTRGLEVVHRRAAGLGRFMTSYAQLARLPDPEPEVFEVRPWLERVVGLETRLDVEIAGGPDFCLEADPDQLDQVLINLLRNAVDAALLTEGGVRLGWQNSAGQLEIWIEDDGPGVHETKNLFVPFFTTKQGGSGIGLALSRQIVEAHGGQIALRNRNDGSGCRASVRLPVRL